MIFKEKEFYFNKLISEGRRSIIWNNLALIDKIDFEIRLADNNKSNLLQWLYLDNNNLFNKYDIIGRASIKSILYQNHNKQDIFDIMAKSFTVDNFKNPLVLDNFLTKIYSDVNCRENIFMNIANKLDIFHIFLIAGINVNLLDANKENIFCHFILDCLNSSLLEKKEKFLEEHKSFFKEVNINNKDEKFGETVLMKVFRSYNQKAQTFFYHFLNKNLNIDYDVLNKNGENILFYAIKYKIELDITSEIIEKSKLLNIKNNLGVDLKLMLKVKDEFSNACNIIIGRRNLNDSLLSSEINSKKVKKI